VKREDKMTGEETELLLSVACIVLTGFSKIPQIIELARADSIGGFSESSLHLMLISNCLQTGFYISESYPLLIYLEYPLLIAQELVLLFLAGKLSSSTRGAVQFILGYLLITTLVSVGLLPKALVLLILSLNIPLGLSSKVAQVTDIVKADSSEGVSSLPFLINLSTRMARLVTTFTSGVTPEPLLITNSLIQMTANACVLVLIQLYRNQKVKTV